MMKRFILALALTVIGMPGMALGQSVTPHVDTIQGIEISPGIVDTVHDIRYGAAFAARATGALPGAVVVAVNYTPASPGAFITNVIIGGHWALTVTRNGRFIGTIYGKATDGAAVWDDTGTVAAINVILAIEGGTRRFAGVTGTGAFVGTLDHGPLAVGHPPTIDGTLDLSF